MKFAPLALSVCSSSGGIPSTMDGEHRSSSSMYNHCRSDSASTASGSLDDSFESGVRRAGDGRRRAGIMETAGIGRDADDTYGSYVMRDWLRQL
jgi:hypothetical protein